MPRTARKTSSTGIYHLLLRSNYKLFPDTQHNDTFLEIMYKYLDKGVLAYLLLDNRIHIILNVGNDSLSLKLKPFLTSFARYYNRVNNTQGKLFYDRYKSTPIESDVELCAAGSFLKVIAGVFKKEAALVIDNSLSSKISDTPYGMIFPESYDELSDKTVKAIALKVSKNHEAAVMLPYIGRTRLRTILGINPPKTAITPTQKTETEPASEPATEPAPAPQKKKQLSVWLL